MTDIRLGVGAYQQYELLAGAADDLLLLERKER